MQILNLDFPIKNLVSFEKVFVSLEQMSEDQDENLSKYAKGILKEMEAYPELRDGFEDFTYFEKYKSQIDKLTRILFPDALLTNEIKSIAPPFMFKPFKKSTRFENIMNNAPKDFDMTKNLKSLSEEMFYLMGCSAILTIHYGYPAIASTPLIIDIPNTKTGKNRYYRIAFNADLTELYPSDTAPEITDEDFRELSNNFGNIDLWKEKFPPNSWVMKGVGIMNLMDVTMDQSIANITSNLLFKETDTFHKIRDNIRAFFNLDDIKIGFTDYEDNYFTQGHKNEFKSILLNHNEHASCDSSICKNTFHTVFDDKKPLVITDTEKFLEETGSTLANNLVDQNVKSYILHPILHDNDILGFVEVASENKNELNSFTLQKLKEVMPVISMATARYKSEYNNRIEAIIQEECTTIHPSVKWKFTQEAREYIHEQMNSGKPRFKDIVFNDIHPLYGQMDIKSSSLQRNHAVTQDLVQQLHTVVKILKEAYISLKLPTIEELILRTQDHVEEVSNGLLAGSEHKISNFLKAEIYPMFDLLKENIPHIAKEIETYDLSLDDKVGILYEERKNWDESVTMANQMMATFIDEKQIEAQEMFPHYFERYKTDGLEYNMYIGDSISQYRKYNPLYLDNLRLWQFQMMCEMEREFKNLQPNLKTPVEVASLILVYNSPLSINFRMDEKRFDVDGAYNARYEIVKKRVDKAHIKGTDERITQPGKISIIYTSNTDRQEYKKYIQYLEAKDFLVKGSMEKYDLEDLQGITGLKALRVEVKYS